MGCMPWNSPKRPPYRNSTSDFDFDNITAVDISLRTRAVKTQFQPFLLFDLHVRTVCEILSKSDHPQQKNDVMSILKISDLSYFGFSGSNNGFFEKPMYDFL